MDLKSLSTLVAIADYGSFVAAARVVGLSLSRVSLQMSQLEREVGQALFDRHRRPPRLTADGRLLVNRARDLLQRWERLREATNASGTAPLLRVGAVHSCVATYMAPALRHLQDKRSELRILLQTGLSHELEAQLADGLLDCAVTSEPDLSGRPEWRLHLLAREPLWVIAPAGAAGADSATAILRANPYLRFAREARLSRLIDQALLRQHLQIESAMEIGTLDAVLALVQAGLGVSVVPAAATAWLPAGVRAVMFGDPPLTRQVALVERLSHGRQPLVAMLLEAIRTARPPVSAVPAGRLSPATAHRRRKPPAQ